MTKQYDRLCDGPQTDINRSDLAPAERTQVRDLRVNRNSDVSPPYSGQFTTVYYLEGNERAAARIFAKENSKQLAAINFSHPDPVQQSVPRDVYDWILHYTGERELRKYQTVVYERRRDGIEWVIDRELFDTHPTERYRPQSSTAVAREHSLKEVFDEFDIIITETALKDHGAIEGNPRMVLEYYRIAGPFDCEPTMTDDELAITKPR